MEQSHYYVRAQINSEMIKYEEVAFKDGKLVDEYNRIQLHFLLQNAVKSKCFKSYCSSEIPLQLLSVLNVMESLNVSC